MTTTTEPGTVQHLGTFGWADPRELLIDAFNHRKARDDDDNSTEPDPGLIDSVMAIGVTTPLVVRPQGGMHHGRLGVVAGQRRLKAAQLAAEYAIAAGDPVRLVPVLIREDLRAADDETLISSLSENLYRADPTGRDILDVAHQLALMPLGDEQRVRAARTIGLTAADVAAAPTAAKLTDRNLDEAVRADFDLIEMADLQSVETIPGAISTLFRAKMRDTKKGDGTRGHWAHTLTALKEQVSEAAVRERMITELKAAGVRVIPLPNHWTGSPVRALSDLVTTLGNPLTEEAHVRCPGHAAAVSPTSAVMELVCTDWKAAEHDLTDAAKQAGATPKASEEAAEERRQVIRYNKAWRQARTVRRDFVTSLCAASGDADDATWTLILSVITGTSYEYRRHTGSTNAATLVAKFLGLADPNANANGDHDRSKDPFGPTIATLPKSRRWSLLFAEVAAMFEDQVMHDAAWRAPSASMLRWWDHLTAHGYTPHEIEAELIEDLRRRLGPASKPKQ
ncbi:ParB/RepB/Spo0J family partition protein (plasmid) [Streptomyces sp. BI20]|uniref:ParB/RepB/Spo0J family partition protein n=1 Tax=Streptomyces sp. BI20 TaxID=3403460 RepID=UPI003C775C0D